MPGMLERGVWASATELPLIKVHQTRSDLGGPEQDAGWCIDQNYSALAKDRSWEVCADNGQAWFPPCPGVERADVSTRSHQRRPFHGWQILALIVRHRTAYLRPSLIPAPLLRCSVMRRFRCAIYTRKSSEDGLEQDFNSLDAQREACATYIASQKHEG